jgi:hypothetical protein
MDGIEIDRRSTITCSLTGKVFLARCFYEKIKEIDGFEAGPHPDWSMITYRCFPKAGDADVLSAIDANRSARRPHYHQLHPRKRQAGASSTHFMLSC